MNDSSSNILLHLISFRLLYFQAGLRSFCLGYGMQAAIKFVGSLPLLFKKPSSLLGAFKDKDNFYCGAFLSSYTGLYKVCTFLLSFSPTPTTVM